MNFKICFWHLVLLELISFENFLRPRTSLQYVTNKSGTKISPSWLRELLVDSFLNFLDFFNTNTWFVKISNNTKFDFELI